MSNPKTPRHLETMLGTCADLGICSRML